jgi:hypothetical protein
MTVGGSHRPVEEMVQEPDILRCVCSEVTGEPGEQVLAVRDVAQHRQPGQVRGRVRGYPQLAVRQHALAQRIVEAAG